MRDEMRFAGGGRKHAFAAGMMQMKATRLVYARVEVLETRNDLGDAIANMIVIFDHG